MRLAILTTLAVGLAIFAWQDGPLRQLLGGTTMPPGMSSDRHLAEAAQPTTIASAQASPSRPAENTKSLTTTKPTEAAKAAGVNRNPLAELNRGRLRAIVERPLFSHTRRPPLPVASKPQPKPVVVRPPPPRAPPVQLTLVGVIAGHGQFFALLYDRRARKTVKVSVGDEVRGWRIATIEDGVVRIQHKRWKRSITLYKK